MSRVSRTATTNVNSGRAATAGRLRAFVGTGAAVFALAVPAAAATHDGHLAAPKSSAHGLSSAAARRRRTGPRRDLAALEPRPRGRVQPGTAQRPAGAPERRSAGFRAPWRIVRPQRRPPVRAAPPGRARAARPSRPPGDAQQRRIVDAVLAAGGRVDAQSALANTLTTTVPASALRLARGSLRRPGRRPRRRRASARPRHRERRRGRALVLVRRLHRRPGRQRRRRRLQRHRARPVDRQRQDPGGPSRLRGHRLRAPTGRRHRHRLRLGRRRLRPRHRGRQRRDRARRERLLDVRPGRRQPEGRRTRNRQGARQRHRRSQRIATTPPPGSSASPPPSTTAAARATSRPPAPPIPPR